jgi:anti-sigma B factor antagonist
MDTQEASRVDVVISRHLRTGTTVVTLVGQLDIDTAPQVHATFDQLRHQSVTRVAVDLGHLTFCDSTGLSALALAHNYCTRAGGYLHLARPTPFLARLLTVVGIAQVVPVHPTIEAACTANLTAAPPGSTSPELGVISS